MSWKTLLAGAIGLILGFCVSFLFGLEHRFAVVEKQGVILTIDKWTGESQKLNKGRYELVEKKEGLIKFDRWTGESWILSSTWKPAKPEGAFDKLSDMFFSETAARNASKASSKKEKDAEQALADFYALFREAGSSAAYQHRQETDRLIDEIIEEKLGSKVWIKIRNVERLGPLDEGDKRGLSQVR